MNEYQQKLYELLLEKNNLLSASQAQTWIELLWEDFEATYAKVGTYNGPEMTEAIVSTWIERHGEQLHLIQSNNPKYKHLLNRDDYLKH